MSEFGDKLSAALEDHFPSDHGATFTPKMKSFIERSLLAIVSEYCEILYSAKYFTSEDMNPYTGEVPLNAHDIIEIKHVEASRDNGETFEIRLEPVNPRELNSLSNTWHTNVSAYPEFYYMVGTPGSSWGKIALYPKPISDDFQIKVSFVALASEYNAPEWFMEEVAMPYAKAIVAVEKQEFDTHWKDFVVGLQKARTRLHGSGGEPYRRFGD